MDTNTGMVKALKVLKQEATENENLIFSLLSDYYNDMNAIVKAVRKEVARTGCILCMCQDKHMVQEIDQRLTKILDIVRAYQHPDDK